MTSLNFLWIEARRKPHLASGESVPCSIHEVHLQNLRDIRKKNPDLDINLWIDICGDVGNDQAFRTTFQTTSGLSGLAVRDLRDISSYQSNSLFVQNSVNPQAAHDVLWQQVDLAKLLVVEHALNSGDDPAFFSDMDIVNPPVNFDAVKQSLNKHGMIFGVFPFAGSGQLENQFFGFANKQRPFLSDVLIPETRNDIERKNMNGWEVFRETVLKQFRGRSLEGIDFTVDAYQIENRTSSTPCIASSVHHSPE